VCAAALRHSLRELHQAGREHTLTAHVWQAQFARQHEKLVIVAGKIGGLDKRILELVEGKEKSEPESASGVLRRALVSLLLCQRTDIPRAERGPAHSRGRVALAVLQSTRRDNWLGSQTKIRRCKTFSAFELPAYNNKLYIMQRSPTIS
jgi:hypothetical protein